MNKKKTSLRRIALVADSPNWVFARIAARIKDCIECSFDVRIFYTSENTNNASLVASLYDSEPRFDIVHYFWRNTFCDLFHPATWVVLANSCNDSELEQITTRISQTIKTSWVCDHLFLDKTFPSIWNRRILEYTTAYGTSSKRLKAIYSENTYQNDIHELQDGVDLTLFRPEARLNSNKTNKKVVIGWAGNSEWGPGDRDHKGLNTIVKPAIERLRTGGSPVLERFCDRAIEWTEFEEMPEYFHSIDIFTCASIDEGTPNTILEAMACGVPVVTTNIGIVDEVFGDLQRKFIVETRSAQAFEEKLRVLVEDPQLRTEISKENLARIESWDWRYQIKNWAEFIDCALTQAHHPSLERQQLATLRQSIDIAKRHIASGRNTRLRGI